MQHQPGEVPLNYMFDFINRFTAWEDPKITESFDGILGKEWRNRLDPALPRHEAVQLLFADEFRKTGKFAYVLSTRIDKLSDRQDFSIVYGSRSPEGLAAYRKIEFVAMKAHGMRRREAKQAIREVATGQTGIFAIAGLAPLRRSRLRSRPSGSRRKTGCSTNYSGRHARFHSKPSGRP